MAPGTLKHVLPARTLIVLAVVCVFSLGFVFLFLLPEYRAVDNLGRLLVERGAALETRRQMVPVVRALKDAQARMPAVGAAAELQRMPLSDVGRLTEIFDALAAPHGLRVTAVSPDASSVSRDGVLAVRLGLLGQADGFRNFLLSLGRFGPLVKVESATTLMGRDGREFTMKCWLAVQ